LIILLDRRKAFGYSIYFREWQRYASKRNNSEICRIYLQYKIHRMAALAGRTPFGCLIPREKLGKPWGPEKRDSMAFCVFSLRFPPYINFKAQNFPPSLSLSELKNNF